MSRAVIADEAIRLRPLTAGDAEIHLAGCDQVIVDSLGGGEPPKFEQVRLWLAANSSAWASDEPVVDLGIEDQSTGSLCGTVGIQRGLDYLKPGQVNLTLPLCVAGPPGICRPCTDSKPGPKSPAPPAVVLLSE